MRHIIVAIITHCLPSAWGSVFQLHAKQNNIISKRNVKLSKLYHHEGAVIIKKADEIASVAVLFGPLYCLLKEQWNNDQHDSFFNLVWMMSSWLCYCYWMQLSFNKYQTAYCKRVCWNKIFVSTGNKSFSVIIVKVELNGKTKVTVDPGGEWYQETTLCSMNLVQTCGE